LSAHTPKQKVEKLWENIYFLIRRKKRKKRKKVNDKPRWRETRKNPKENHTGHKPALK
jgi:hypothetical protein